jgi:hypothetical protein
LTCPKIGAFFGSTSSVLLALAKQIPDFNNLA